MKYLFISYSYKITKPDLQTIQSYGNISITVPSMPAQGQILEHISKAYREGNQNVRSENVFILNVIQMTKLDFEAWTGQKVKG